METQKRRLTTVLFDNRESAEKAYQEALAKGYKPEEINVIMSEDTRKKYYDSVLVEKVDGDKSMDGLALGGATGGAIGGTLGAILGIGSSIVFPGVGLVLTGPLVGGLIGAGAGSISGGLIGTLIGWGISEERAKVYETGVKSGGVVLGVNENPEVSNLEEDWKKYTKD
jgi:hypothetical protein